MRRLMRKARNPLKCCRLILERFVEKPDWAANLGFESCMAKDYTADVYRNNTTARTRLLQFFREHGNLDACNAAKPLLAIADTQDAFVLEDGVEVVPEIINSQGYEELCGWGYGPEQVFLPVRKEEECKEGTKRKTRVGSLRSCAG